MAHKTLSDIKKLVEKNAKGDLISANLDLDELTFTVKLASIGKFLRYLRDGADLEFKQLIDLCGADYPARPERFEVVYHLLSIRHNTRVRVKVSVAEGKSVPTVSSVYSAANWYERETWDLYGIEFEGHPNLTRILTGYDFVGHPLRKDFPLTGFLEPRYDDEKQKVVYHPVNLPQEFRNFDYLSPWEGMTPERPQMLPGDEKATQDKNG